MSFVTKLFVIFSLLVSVIFVFVAGALVAKQENFKHRYTSELVERQRDDQLQDRLRNRLAAAQERKRREIVQLREKILLNKEKVARARHAKLFADIAQQRVAEAMDRFSAISDDFGPIVLSYEQTLANLVEKASMLADRRNEMVKLRSDTWVHLAQAQAEVGRLREHLNVLDYKLYVVRQANLEQRQLLTAYAEADPATSNAALGDLVPITSAMVIAVDAEHNSVLINMGHNESIQPHMVFTIVRNGDFVANIEITQVYHLRSAGRILQGSQAKAIVPGDQVRPRGVFGSAVRTGGNWNFRVRREAGIQLPHELESAATARQGDEQTMATFAKILIALIFVISNVFLGFTVAAIQNRDDNPKYKYMREKWMRDVIRFDCRRLMNEIAEGRDGKPDLFKTTKDALEGRYKALEQEYREIDAETRRSMVKLRTGHGTDDAVNLLADLEKIQLRVSNSRATIKAYREALASVQRKYANLQDSYANLVRQFESLAIEKKRVQLEKERVVEDHRALEDAYFEAQKENASLTDRIGVMLRINPNLDEIVRRNGRFVDGKVTSATEPPTGVVVISVGSNEGVTRGQRFSVFDVRGNFKARIHIVEVRPNESVGVVESPYENVKIDANDTVQRSAIYLNEAAPTGSGTNR